EAEEKKRRASCWDGYHTEERCCFGLVDPPRQWAPAVRNAPAVQCLMATARRSLNLSDTPATCRGRYFAVATLGQLRLRMDFVASGMAWFLVPSMSGRGWGDYVARYGPTGVHDHRVVGGLCLPEACDLGPAAMYVVPRVAPWWPQPTREPAPLNDTHVWLPPPLAVSHDLFASHGFMPMWVSKPACPGTQDSAFCSHYWEFAVQEYHHHIGDCSEAAVAAAVAIVLVSVLWLSVESKPLAHWVNAAFVMLSIHLRRPTPSREKNIKVRCMLKVLRHAGHRWLRMCPLLVTSTLVYLCGFVTCIPMNNAMKSSALHTWFSERRAECLVPRHLVLTILMLHEPVTGRASPCHNADIFETLFLLDVLTFALMQVNDGASWLLLPPALLWRCCWVLGEGEGRWALAYRHRFTMLLPVALLAVGVGSLERNVRSRFAARSLNFVGTLLISTSCLQDALNFGTAEWTYPLGELAEGLRQLKPLQQAAAFHVSELLFVLGFRLLLADSSSQQQVKKRPWSWVSFLASLCPGMNLSNLFIFHFLAGFYLDEPQPLSGQTAMRNFMNVSVLSA
ncbi:unnamed protein product, partial [Symbiodinium pilosum]